MAVFSLAPLCARLLRCRRGTAAIEFAFIAPLLLLILLGSIEAVDLYRAQRAALVSVNSLADLTARTKSMDDTQRDIVFSASKQLLKPFDDGAPVSLVITSVQADSDGDLTTRWSVANANGTAHKVGDPFTLPNPNDVPPVLDGDTIVVAEMSYTYRPRLTHFIMSSLEFSRVAYRSPRYVPRIPYPPVDP